MKTKLHYLIIAVLFGVVAMNAQPYVGTNVWLTGTGVGGWTEGGVIHLNSTDGITYYKNNFEIKGDGEIKFTEGTWATAATVTVGQPEWPSGVANNTAGGTPNIHGVLGFWNVTFDYPTKAYTFTPGVNPNRAISLDGTAITGGTLALSTPDGINYAKESVVVAAGTGAFVEKVSPIQPSPTANWSSSTWPAAIGTQGGAPIPVVAGVWNVGINITDGSYFFDPIVMCPLGDFNGWNDLPVAPADPTMWEMTTTDNINYEILVTFSSGGNMKFRDNHSWNTQFGGGGAVFPSGTLVQGGGDIPYTAGVYLIKVNRATNAIQFISQNPNINLNAPNVAASPVALGSADGTNYSAQHVIFSAGVAVGSFNEVASAGNPAGPYTNWTGINTPDGALTPGGAYNVAFNKTTGVYSFPYVVYGITGSMNGWGGNVDLSTTDGNIYTLNNYVLAAAADFKIRENHSWAYNNFGSTTNPPGASGTIVHEGTNFHLEPGTWNIELNRQAMTFTFTVALAVNKFEANKFSVYPNPTNNSWNFTSANSEISSVRIVDMLGKTVMSKKASSSEVSVDASSLSKGMYFAKITSGDSVQTVKVIRD